MYKLILGAVSGVALAACGLGEISQHQHEAVVVLEGAELEDELRASPSREAPQPFLRLGVLWDASAPGTLEVSTSDNGTSWSPWTPVNVSDVIVEREATFVGAVELADAATHYRLRAGASGAPSYLWMEFLESRLSDAIEDGSEPLDSIQFAVGNVDINPRSAWGAKGPRCSSGSHSPYRMAIHHTETPTNDTLSPEARLRGIQSYHQNVRGWCDIGYHFLMSGDGRLWAGRNAGRIGAHAGAGNNTGNLGISVMGSHSTVQITSAQLASISSLVAGLGDDYGIALDRTKIKGHREYKPTSCPGNALFGQLDDIVAIAGSGTAPPPTPTPTPTPTPGTVSVRGVLYEGSDPSDRIAGASVTLGSRSTTSSSSGYWEFSDVASGEFTVTASAGGYATRAITKSTYASETWSSFGLQPAMSISGNAALIGVIYDGPNSESRVPHATVTLSTGHSVIADENGFYRLDNLPAGAVVITSTASGFDTANVSRTLVDGSTVWGSVRVAAQ